MENCAEDCVNNDFVEISDEEIEDDNNFTTDTYSAEFDRSNDRNFCAEQNRMERLASNLQPSGDELSLIGEITETSFVFCVDISARMIASLARLKFLLISTLKSLCGFKNRQFNIVVYSSEVCPWKDRPVSCCEQNVAAASAWLDNFPPTTGGSNTLEALLTAFENTDDVEGVFLICRSLPDQDEWNVLDHVGYASKGRPVHCVYLQEGAPDADVTEFLHRLARKTLGSLRIISIDECGHLIAAHNTFVADVVRSTSGVAHPRSPPTYQTRMTTNHNGAGSPYDNPQLPSWYWDSFWFLRPEREWTRWQELRSKLSPGSSTTMTLLPGAGFVLLHTKVLARRQTDGLYYMGTVHSQILHDFFLVQFDACTHGQYQVTTYQETYVYDMVAYVGALRHAILRGDCVLAPFEADGQRFAPATVISGQERRAAKGGPADSLLLTASFHDGKTAQVASDVAVWIPRSLHDRITFELQLPAGERQRLLAARSVEAPPFPAPIPGERSRELREPYVPVYPIVRPPWQSTHDGGGETTIVPGSSLTRKQLDEKVNALLQKHGVSVAPSNDVSSVRRDRRPGRPILRKSVSFRQDQDDLEAEYLSGDLEMRPNRDEREMVELLENVPPEPPLRLLRRRRRARSAERPRQKWRYWNNEPAPEMMAPLHFGPYAQGPFSGTDAPVAVTSRRRPNFIDWSDAMGPDVDGSAVHAAADTTSALRHPLPPVGPPAQHVGVAAGRPGSGRVSRKDVRREQGRACRRAVSADRRSVSQAERERLWSEERARLSQRRRSAQQREEGRQRRDVELAQKAQNSQAVKQEKHNLLQDRQNAYRDSQMTRTQLRQQNQRAARQSRDTQMANEAADKLRQENQAQVAREAEIRQRQSQAAERIAEQVTLRESQERGVKAKFLQRRHAERKREQAHQLAKKNEEIIKDVHLARVRAEILP